MWQSDGTYVPIFELAESRLPRLRSLMGALGTISHRAARR
jgi:hypothetical protein